MTESANPVRRLAQCTSSPECVQSMLNTFIIMFNNCHKRLDCRRFMQLLIPCHQHPRRQLHQKHLLNRETAFNLHKAKPDHRGRGKRLRLPSPRQIENAPPLLHAKPWPSCAGRFRSWLTVIRPELEKLEVSTPTTPDE